MNYSPLVSVILPNYKTDEYISKAIESALNQSYENIEIILVDSSGLDETQNLADAEDRITYVFQEPKGLSAARNRALDEASGEVIAFLDADDYWHENKLKLQVAELQRGEADIIYTDEYLMDGEEQRYHSTLKISDPSQHYIKFFKYGSGIPVRTIAARQECFEHHRFNENLRAREDSHLWVRLFRDFEPSRIPKALATKRIREDAMTADIEMMYESEIESIHDLIERIPELRKWQSFRESRTHYKYGKQYFETQQSKLARKALIRDIKLYPQDVRAWTLLALVVSPFSIDRQKQLKIKLERIHNSVFQ